MLKAYGNQVPCPRARAGVRCDLVLTNLFSIIGRLICASFFFIHSL